MVGIEPTTFGILAQCYANCSATCPVWIYTTQCSATCPVWIYIHSDITNIIMKMLFIMATFKLYRTAFRSAAKAPIRCGMYNFQKLSETTSLLAILIPLKRAFLKGTDRWFFPPRYGKISGTVET